MSFFFLPSFWAFALLFIVAIFFAFYIPGSILLKKFRLPSFSHITLSLLTGIVLWGWQGFIFGFLTIRWATYLYLVVFFILWLRSTERKKLFLQIKNISRNSLSNIDFLLVFLVSFGTLLQLTGVFFMSIMQKNGVSFCCTLPDSLYHIALTSQLIKQVPPTEPGMAGVIVHNYHYMSNLVAADLIRIFHLPLIPTIYQYFVVLFSLLIGLSAIAFGKILHMKKEYIRWLVFFLYFSGDITFLLTFLTGNGFNFNTPFLENALWLWISPPRVFAAVIFFEGISLFVLWIKQKDFLLGILVAFVFSSLISFKIYDGVFMAAGVIGLFIYFLFTKQFRMIVPLLITGILSLILYLPVNSQSGGFVFTGMWSFQNFIVQPALGLVHLEMAREIYAAHHNWLGVMRFELLFFALYVIFVFGTIILGIFQTKKSLSLFPRELNIFLISGIAACSFLGFFFIQTSGGANSSQFLITVDIIGAVYTALACYYWIGKISSIFRYIVVFLIISLTLPRVFDIAHSYIKDITATPSLFIDTKQLQALDFIQNSSSPNSIILVDNFERPPRYVYNKKLNKRVEVYVQDSRTWKGNFSYYISFLTNRPLFLDGDMNTNSIVQSHGVDTNKRVRVQTIILADKNAALVQTLVHQNNIGYIYLDSKATLAQKPPSFLKPVFKNSEITILQVM